MNTKRLPIFITLLVLLLTACSQKKMSEEQALRSQGISNGEQVVKETQVVKQTSIQAPKAMPTMAPAIKSQGSEQTTTTGDVAMLNYQTSDVHMVIKDAELALLVDDTDRAIDQVSQMTADYGGYLISSQSWYDGEFKYATIRLAVPSQSFETALTNLRHIGAKVVKETGSGQDVSSEYTDLQSRLTNLEATAARVRDFLNAAQTVDESLRVNQQLSDLEGQIEQVKGQMKYYEGRSAFSTITADLVPQRPTPTPSPTALPTPTPTPKPGWNPGNTFHNASGVLSALFRGTVDLLIWLTVVFGPRVLALGLLIWVLDRVLHLRARLQVNRRSLPSLPAAPANPDNQTIEK
jgi:hypothetical protein